MAIMLQIPSEVTHSLLGGNDGIDHGYVCLHDAKVVVDDIGKEVLSS